MKHLDDLNAEAVPVRSGWSIRVRSGSDRVAEGVVRIHHGVTWMQQRRAIEERLRSWGFAVADTAWTRNTDGGIRLALGHLGGEEPVVAA